MGVFTEPPTRGAILAWALFLLLHRVQKSRALFGVLEMENRCGCFEKMKRIIPNRKNLIGAHRIRSHRRCKPKVVNGSESRHILIISKAELFTRSLITSFKNLMRPPDIIRTRSRRG